MRRRDLKLLLKQCKPNSTSGISVTRTLLSQVHHASPISTVQSKEDISLITASNIAKSVHLRFSYLWEKKDESLNDITLKDLFVSLSYVSPKSVRLFWRVSYLKPENVCDILLGFRFDVDNHANEGNLVGILWKLFNWSSRQSESFQHLAQSYEIMASMLARVGLLKEAELLLREMELERRGVLYGCEDVFSKIIEGYVTVGELEDSVSVYNWMRSRRLVPSESCVQCLVKNLMERRKSKSTYRVCMDMFRMGFGLSPENMRLFESAVKLLCKAGMVKEARNICRKLVACGVQPSCVVVNLIADGYNEKKDYEDLLNFMKERKCVPDDPICNKILSSQCRFLGSEQAYLFMIELENLGFTPSDVTFGIFIQWSSREGKLKNAFIYLSELLSRCLRPNIYSYNALISGVFKKGLWNHAMEIFQEMLDMGVTPDLSTFEVLLAGYCKFRRFDEVKVIIFKMVERDLIQLSEIEDPLSKAFFVLGFKPSDVKVKRVNNVGLQKAEFFDSVGNGLYLETDIDYYEKVLTKALEDAMIPDRDFLIVKECSNGNVKTALMLKSALTSGGQKLSLSAYSALLKGLCVSRSNFSKAISLYEELPELVYRLDRDTLNLFIRVISKKGVPHKGKMILEGMLRRDLSIEKDTYTALIMGLCKKGCHNNLRKCWELARSQEWLPTLKDCKPILEYLCQIGMLKEVLNLFEGMLLFSGHSVCDISNIFLGVLCVKGQATVGRLLFYEILQHGVVLKHSAYSNLINGLCMEESYDEAFVTLDSMLEKNMTPSVDIYFQLIPQLCKSNRLEQATALKEIMLRNEAVSPFSIHYGLIKGLFEEGRIEQATVQLQEMISKRMSLDTDIFNAMIQGFCMVNVPSRVQELLSVMLRNNFRLSTLSYRGLVRLMCLHGRELHVLRLKDVLSRGNILPYLAIYNILIFRFLEAGKSSLVTMLLDEMKSKHLMLDEVSYNFLICGYCTCQDLSRSFDLLKTMIDKDLRPSMRSLRMVIRLLCHDNNLDEALILSSKMEVKGWVHGSVVQHAVAEGLLSHGRLEEAENYLKRIINRNLLPNHISYDGLIRLFCQYGRLNMAIDLLDIMLKKGNLPGPTCYDFLIQGFCMREAVDDALNIHTEMLARDFKPSIRSWDMLIHEVCAIGRTVESEKLLDCMIQLGQRPPQKVFQIVIDRCFLDNSHSKMSELLHKMQQHGYKPDFKTHWSLISNLSSSSKEKAESGGFLSKLLSLSGFAGKKDSKVG